jgi:DNA-binding HxlR family transcriptional regulator
MRDRNAPAFCSVYTDAVELIGRRWNGAIVRALNNGVGRFSDLASTIEGISFKMLSERLKELEDTQIVDRIVTASRPVQIAYKLTPKGQALATTLRSIAEWAYQWHDNLTESSASAKEEIVSQIASKPKKRSQQTSKS